MTLRHRRLDEVEEKGAMPVPGNFCLLPLPYKQNASTLTQNLPRRRAEEYLLEKLHGWSLHSPENISKFWHLKTIPNKMLVHRAIIVKGAKKLCSGFRGTLNFLLLNMKRVKDHWHLQKGSDRPKQIGRGDPKEQQRKQNKPRKRKKNGKEDIFL